MPPKSKKEPPPDAALEAAPAPAEPVTGEGEFSFADGSNYNGAWARLESGAVVRQGRGVLTHVALGYKFVGEWKSDQMEGYGEFLYASGAKYAGQWEKNRYSGHGKYNFPDGSTYEGRWTENQMHGAGMFVDKKGIIWKGQFYNGSGPGLSALVV
ncbi:hypothetical protein T492DRAFT_609678 [Pavlovales sp. CCMP2436]|nr:hypothetical protein T492DRAFT_609678 [Pavlovales sp. CCMP2436]|eukprot:CAMPEP_0179915676 /NCGR_PEP_ID=MMETSP0983-20121128/1810_1 /TAXON_ID=483367 /ORGANISM="non described non described, Strain CCMP 2436" /LENGTH=154 /DNA_ID=CAMNT_0021818127 /DNA_START=6 /DNA_END=470 /DNA_ORIENTATION=+